ncbi:hypothetical protein F751_0121 [Auxenochlorella protothecoides]|uniref:Uncharacterized protein n=1 Tax=Auxenochlorella protothecoides TaxID=3075 RepID=A0A087S9N4_AUXPR|nr:hypothetical protein F751_0121 [Auxenochlorella protothecoides]KFM22438.1 hypothetical protein F751_0121 [Auxenochlorella protothecoides]
MRGCLSHERRLNISMAPPAAPCHAPALARKSGVSVLLLPDCSHCHFPARQGGLKPWRTPSHQQQQAPLDLDTSGCVQGDLVYRQPSYVASPSCHGTGPAGTHQPPSPPARMAMEGADEQSGNRAVGPWWRHTVCAASMQTTRHEEVLRGTPTASHSYSHHKP